MPKSVAEQYPELLHYTTEKGLRGIIESGCIWASHASHLNDAEELTHFFDARLYDLAYQAILAYINQLPKKPKNLHLLRQSHGKKNLATSDAKKITALLRKSIIGNHDPYILSLSTPANRRIAENGLLSQWRGYGGDGGYALVLDAPKFDALLQREGAQYQYQFAQWGDVYYYGLESIRQPSSEEVAEYEEVVQRGAIAIVSGKHPDTVPELYDALTSLSCLYKHWGFAEEGEVRVIVIPPSADFLTQAAKSGVQKKHRQPKTFPRAGIQVPYIELFKALYPDDKPGILPIKRVIVGPHQQKKSRVALVQELLHKNGYSADVMCSEIPYLG